MKVSTSKRSDGMSARMASLHFENRLSADSMPNRRTHPGLGWRKFRNRYKRPMRALPHLGVTR